MVPKFTGYPAASIANRNVHAMNKSFENINGFAQSQTHYQPKLARGFVPEYGWYSKENSINTLHNCSIYCLCTLTFGT